MALLEYATPTVQAKGLVKKYGKILAVNDISFTISKGETIGLLGGNGAGKTTTIAMLLGLLLPTAGQIKIFGEDIEKGRNRVLSKMNFSSPYVDFPKRLSVVENLNVYARLYGLENVTAVINRVAQNMELEEFLQRPTGSLSAGQMTRVSLAKALLNDPELLLLDEPTASLDPDTGDTVRSHIENWKTEKGATILLASHNMNEVERLCSKVMVMAKGQIIDKGSPSELVDRYGRSSLEEVFLDIVRQEKINREN
ncbi:MAG: ABC transporter ATP-binding protein NatA [Alphaproteobacteria bacterium MarineAlpha3_Bin5]|nr:ABC transporter [Magnetovibrio sp.]PPR80104.1 MAG: ABC transporter ATP-binding protein NatA [Alphaproteobacteria bacterium MarineAlpha3_Bin5]